MHNSLQHFLAGDGAAGKVMAHARLLLKLEHRFAAIAPAGLQHAARVANYKLGKVIIHAENGAVAAKIRQLSQRLCVELSKCGAECNELEVKVQPQQLAYQSRSSTEKPISAKARDTLLATAENLPEGPLRKALSQLLARAGDA